MKTLVLGICLFFWMLISLILVFSLVGLVLFMPVNTYPKTDYVPSVWLTIGKSLLDALINS